MLILLGNIQILTRGLHHAIHKLLGHLIQLPGKERLAARPKDVKDELVIVLYVVEGIEKSLLPVGGAVFARKGLAGFLFQKPPQEIINILKMIIESLAVDLAGLYNLFDCNIIQALFFQKLFQSRSQRLLGGLRHSFLTSLQRGTSNPKDSIRHRAGRQSRADSVLQHTKFCAAIYGKRLKTVKKDVNISFSTSLYYIIPFIKKTRSFPDMTDCLFSFCRV